MNTKPSDLLDLTGRTALVTGASGTIGGAIAKVLAGAGAAVLVHYHNDEAGAKAVYETIIASGGAAYLCQFDLASDAQRADGFALVAQKTGGIDILVNNAAIQPVQALGSMDDKDWRALFAVNLDAAASLTRQMARALIARQSGGAVINIASIEGLSPAAGHAHYAAAKAALIQFTRAAALEYGAHDIRVNAISPGLIDRDGLISDWPEGVARWQEKVPLGRMGTPQDVANAALFLASPMSAWISGENLVVDGGMMSTSHW